MVDLEKEIAHKFWNTQPVLQKDEKPKEEGQIVRDNDVNKVRKDPYPLVKGFVWSIIDTTDEKQRFELYDFLRQNYVIHPQNTFRFAYSEDFLNWALHPPGWRPEWSIGVRMESNGKLAAYISAIPITVRVHEDIQHIVAVDFLSIHQRLRGKNLAPILIKEVTRRVNLTGIFTAIYTAGRVLTQPFTTAQYFHRLISYEKLCAINFTSLRLGAKIKVEAKKCELPNSPRLPGFRDMVQEDVPQVTVKLNEYLSKYPISQVFTEEEVAYWFLPRPGIVGSYVVEKKKEIIDFVSFYVVPSTVFGCPQYDSYTAAYIFYYFSKPSRLTDLIRAGMKVIHHGYNIDVINCLNIMDNQSFFETLHFLPGDGNLHYYLFNYATDNKKPQECGVVLL
ncbi:myristoyl-CoA:protein N-myristoyltransferase [Histomonas meleagridis]|uniref:myristoyl-CoA:protein N-myristoyltransferase n=1 Tax=Histomonas meleagridis TaxID=135588 RepID=UPI00355A91B8|nr:myristoyl-CoA:protein N-myristoyltransferase [Histomonas meleagridis]KAH0796891.1 myristoyl-CoA:protein N-myristoyltransferase [Histomonas meleagridis]